MTRVLAPLGLVGAVCIGALGAAVLIGPAEAAVAPQIEQVAAVALTLPDDPPLRSIGAGHAAPPVAPAVGPTVASPELQAGTRIRVPRLRIDLAIEPGDSARDIGAQATPASAAYLLQGSAVPGTAGNAYLYAHARPGLFLALWNARLGDAIEVTGPSGTVLRYVVTEIHPRVDPTDLRYITATDDERLTLQTSTGTWALSPRFVVVALPAR